MRPSSAKAKGRKLQQDVVALLRKYFPHWTERDVRSTSMGASGEDVLFSQSAFSECPLSVECKNQEALNIWAALAQAEKRPGIPAVFFKRNGTKIYVALPAEAFLLAMGANHIMNKERDNV